MTRKILIAVFIALVLTGGTAWIYNTYFSSPVFSVTALASTSARPFAGGQDIRLKGVVMYGTVERGEHTAHFVITDCQNDLPVEYTGALPEKFHEGVAVTVTGTLETGNVFRAGQLRTHRGENCDAEMMQGRK